MDQCVITYGEFMREREAGSKAPPPAAARPDAAPAAPTNGAQAAAQIAAQPLVVAPVVTEAPVVPRIHTTIKPQPPRLSFSVKPGAPLPRVAVGITGYKLKPLLDFIIDQAGGKALPKIAAQLAVYRVFRRVPRELVLADNIHSLKIGDPTIEVHNKDLYDAIVRAIETTFGVKYEPSAANSAAG
ncbi:MAG: hypothetical protein JO347_03620, partial [Candidatus Eremiobacteraeota bacterium]|nr:hypothetical protein [Candidatus Eremiobacteraeota bacterium]